MADKIYGPVQEQEVSGGNTDEMLDELFKKHGKVVYRSGDQKRPAAEADDDAECLSCKCLLIFS